MQNSFLILGLLLFITSCTTETKPSDTNVSDQAPKTDVSKVVDSETSTKNILFFGNSLTAAYQLDPDDGFTALIQNKLDAEKLNYKTINAGTSGDTSADGDSKIDWVLEQKVDIFVLELGANDGMRGFPIKETLSNLQSIIDKVKKKYPAVKIVIAGMEAPPNMGEQFTSEFRNIFPKLAKTNEAALIPFLLEGVAGKPTLNLKDGIHPTAEGHKILAENVWEILKPLL